MANHDQPRESEGQPPLWRAALFGLCPACGQGPLFKSAIGFAPACSHCGLNFQKFNVGDGPAALLVMVVGAIVVPAALALHFKVHPPLVAHLVLWPLVILFLTLGGLRVAKAGLLASEHQREGREGRLVSPTDDGPDDGRDEMQ
jgi:uncharacterized protein (DUF983 family)